jgi:hypothetical protein
MERDVRWLVSHRFLQHVVLDGTVSQAMAFVLTVQQRWQRLSRRTTP